jgi:hypothetical protein
MRLPAAGNDLKVETLTYGYDRLGKPATLKTSLDGPTTRPLLCVEDDQGRCHAAVHGSAADRSPRCVTGSGGSDARNAEISALGHRSARAASRSSEARSLSAVVAWAPGMRL